jgi:uncharacterized protein YecE (DUF72 family)
VGHKPHDSVVRTMLGQFRIGCAGWTIPRQHAALFPKSGNHLERYAGRFSAVEINSSFYRPHRHSTYERWAAAVPNDFAFAVKAPREITHHRRLTDIEAILDVFLTEVTGLGEKSGPLLFQLPPNLAFDLKTVRSFLATLRARFDGVVVCEPRHADWFVTSAEDLLTEFRIARAAVDPACVPTAAEPGGWNDLAYFRLHGSPRVYYSEYGPDRIARLAQQLARAGAGRSPVWCIFDNTATGAATADALAFVETLRAC